jgi:cystathionine beta-synthase
MWHDSILGTIGGTPLVRINRLADDLPCVVLAKLEYFNPGSSVKDRIGISMIDDAERSGKLRPGGTIIEGTSGNTGAGLAIVAIARGYRCIFTTTDKQSQEKTDVLRAFGAEVMVCPTNVTPEDPRSYYSVARRLAEEIPNSIYLNQYDNPANSEAHYRTTGPELWEQTDGRITHYIVGAGTGGTISGASRFLKERQPDLKVIGVDPFGSVYYKYFHERQFDEKEIYPYLTEGVGEDILAKNMDFDAVDDYVRVTDREAMQMTRRLAREEGIFAGQSSGMVVAGAMNWLREHRAELREEDVVVILIPDSGFRYLSKTYNDAWMRNHGFIDRAPGLTCEDIVSARRKKMEIVAVEAGESLGDAVSRMAEYGISQLPVYEEGSMVGSLTENDILARLIEHPEARNEPVRAAMGPPLPIVPSSVDVETLTEYLDNEMGAVLVADEKASRHYILTKSDLISALASTGRNGREARHK